MWYIKRNSYKYTDKVVTKSGNVRYIYPKIEQKGLMYTVEANDPDKEGKKLINEAAEGMLKGTAKYIEKENEKKKKEKEEAEKLRKKNRTFTEAVVEDYVAPKVLDMTMSKVEEMFREAERLREVEDKTDRMVKSQRHH